MYDVTNEIEFQYDSDVKQHTITQQLDTKTKPVLRVQHYVQIKDTSTVETALCQLPY